MTIHDYVIQGLRAQANHPDGHPTFGRFLLESGRSFELRFRAPDYPNHDLRPNACFANSLLILFKNKELVYVEGVAIGPGLPIDMHHAWCFDPSTKEIIDETWTKFLGGPGTYYYGVPISRDYAIRRLEAMVRTSERVGSLYYGEGDDDHGLILGTAAGWQHSAALCTTAPELAVVPNTEAV